MSLILLIPQHSANILQVKVWDAEVGTAVQSWRVGEEGQVDVNSQQVGVVWPHGRGDGLIISVDLAGNLNYLVKDSAKPMRVVHGHQGNITAASIAYTNPPTLWTGSYDGQIRNWNIEKGQASSIDGKAHSNYVSGIASSPPAAGSQPRVYSVGWDDTLSTIDASAQIAVGHKPKLSGQPKGITVASTGQTLVATANWVDIFPPEGADVHNVKLEKFTATAISASPTSDLVAIGGEDKTIRIYSLLKTSLEPKATISDDSIVSAPSTIAFSPPGDHLAVGTSSGRICVFKVADHSLVTSRWSAHTSRVTSISWSKDGKYAVSGSLDTNIFVWSLQSPGKRIKALHAHKDSVNGVVWVDEAGENKVLSVGADAAVKTWKVGALE